MIGAVSPVIRPGWPWSLAAVGLAVATAVATRLTATEALVAVTPLVVTGVVLLAVLLFVGSSRWVGVASLPIVGSIVLEAGFADEPSWIRSIVLGCLWYLTLECAWEAIERRDGARWTSAAQRHRVQEVLAVVSISLGVGLVAAAATALAPLRSVLVQALAIGALLGVFTVLLRTAGKPGVE